MSNNELYKYKLFFSGLKYFGIKTMQKLIDKYGSEYDIYNLTDVCIEEDRIMDKRQRQELIEYKKKYDFDRELNKLIKNNTKVSFYGDNSYPSKLYDISDPPYQLFYKGELPDAKLPSVAIIGARQCSSYGYENARLFATELSKNGIQIISGMASGIDGISQKAALDNKGKSFAVLGCGVDICYPQSNYGLYKELLQSGGLLSEYPLGTKPIAMHFPMRNRIISGLVDILLVVEAKEKSGTAITVSMALEQGKEVYAIPGRIGENLSKGCNKMIKEGAGVALSPDDILNDLNIINKSFRLKNDERYTELENRIVSVLRKENMGIEEIFVYMDSISIEALRVALFEMILKGYIHERNGIYSI